MGPARACLPAIAILACFTAARSQGADAHAAVMADVERWSTEHRELVRRVDYGTSGRGRPLVALRLGTAPDGAPEVFVGAAIHGHESSEDDARWLVERVLARRREPAVAELLRTRVLWIAPMLNPDGVVAHTRLDAAGVDLNRNFAAAWAPAGAPGERTHSGATPFSQRETAALRDWLRARTNLRACFDLHRSVNWLVPARNVDRSVDARVRAWAEELDAAMGRYSMRIRGDLTMTFPMPGLLVDWAWQELGVFACALESRGGAEREPDPRWLLLQHALQHATDYPRTRAEPVLPPQDVTAATRADAAALARLQRSGTVLLADGFDDAASLARCLEVRGADDGRVRITPAGSAHRGEGALQVTAAAADGGPSGAGPVLWLGDDGHEVVHLRYWIRYASDFDPGALHHTGGALAGVAGADRWRGMGTAGVKPIGDDHFNTCVETWRDWLRVPSPGHVHCYTYWMDMERDRDGNHWGNMLGPVEADRVVPARATWQCVELRVACNTPGVADGELAVWLDGDLHLHYRGLRWRRTPDVRVKRASLSCYVHAATRDAVVWFDDVIVSTGYVGPATTCAELIAPSAR